MIIEATYVHAFLHLNTINSSRFYARLISILLKILSFYMYFLPCPENSP